MHKHLRILHDMAKQGYVLAQYDLARAYYFGYHVEQDFRKAFIYFKKAARQGHSPSMYFLGTMYHFGFCVRTDHKKAYAIQKKAALSGDPASQFNLSIMYIDGIGTEKNIRKGFKWLRRSADQGLPDAQSRMVDMYITGEYIEQDFEQARIWYEKAAEQAYGNALYNLGIIYAKGEGVEMNIEKARDYFFRSYKAGGEGGLDAYHKLGGDGARTGRPGARQSMTSSPPRIPLDTLLSPVSLNPEEPSVMVSVTQRRSDHPLICARAVLDFFCLCRYADCSTPTPGRSSACLTMYR